MKWCRIFYIKLVTTDIYVTCIETIRSQIHSVGIVLGSQQNNNIDLELLQIFIIKN